MSGDSHGVAFYLVALAFAIAVAGLVSHPNKRQRADPRLRMAGYLWKASMIVAPVLLTVAVVWAIVERAA